MDELEELKRLLIGEERKTLDDLYKRVTDPRSRAADVADILPEAIGRAGEHHAPLVQSLQKPVGECIKLSIQRDTRAFADALFPVMGPAIRRSIAEFLKAFVQSINQTLEQSMSFQGIRWRWESWRTGVPFGEIVLKHTLIYRVEQAFLIHRDTGLMIGRVSISDIVAKDSDAVSAMLTAIQDFVRDSFPVEQDGELETVDMGEHTLWIIRGPYAMLVCEIRGIPPLALRARLESVLEAIHEKYSTALEPYAGDKTPFGGLDDMLRQCLRTEHKTGAVGYRGARTKLLSPPLLVFVLGIGVLLSYWAVSSIEQTRRIAALRDALHQAPGIVVWAIDHEGATPVVKGLADPLAQAAERFATTAGFAQGEVRFELSPYQAMEPDLIRQRARRQLQVPDTVTLRLKGHTLYAVGTAPFEWTMRVAESLGYPAGVETIDLNGIRIDETSLLRRIKALLKPPEGITLRLSEGSLGIAGKAPWHWVSQIPARLEGLTAINGYSLEELVPIEWQEAKTLAENLRSLHIYFGHGVVPRPDTFDSFDEASRILRRLIELDEQLDLQLRINLVGYSDAVGSKDRNQRLRRERGEFLRYIFAQRGLDPNRFLVTTHPTYKTGTGRDPSLRRVSFQVEIQAPMLPSWPPDEPDRP